MPNTEPLLTAAEAAKRVGRSPRTIARWAREGRLPVAQQLPGVRGALLFSPEAVDAANDPEEAA